MYEKVLARSSWSRYPGICRTTCTGISNHKCDKTSMPRDTLSLWAIGMMEHHPESFHSLSNSFLFTRHNFPYCNLFLHSILAVSPFPSRHLHPLSCLFLVHPNRIANENGSNASNASKYMVAVAIKQTTDFKSIKCTLDEATQHATAVECAMRPIVLLGFDLMCTNGWRHHSWQQRVSWISSDNQIKLAPCSNMCHTPSDVRCTRTNDIWDSMDSVRLRLLRVWWMTSPFFFRILALLRFYTFQNSDAPLHFLFFYFLFLA